MSRARDFADLAGSADAGGLTGRNLIINGAMQVAQRGTSQTGVTNDGYKDAPDRFKVQAGTAGTWTVSQSTTAPDGFSNSYKFDCTTANASLSADSNLHLVYKFEGQDLQHLKKGTSGAESITLSFWVRSAKTGTYIAQLKDQDNNRSYAQAYTISSADTWEHKTLTYAGDTTGVLDNDNGDSFRVFWWLVAGSNYTSGTLATAWESTTEANRAVGQVNLADSTSNDWYITGIQLEVGEQATPFEHRSFADEFAKCKRYYQRWDATASDSTSNKPIGAGVWNGTGQVLASFTYDEMRVSPTFTASSTDFVKAYGGGFADARTGGNGLDTIGTKSARFNFTTSTSRTAGHGTMIQMHNDGEFLELDAEL